MTSLIQKKVPAYGLLCLICAIHSHSFARETRQSSQGVPGRIDKGRGIIAELQDEVFARIAYTPEELSLLKEDFQKDYIEFVEPRLKDVAQFISQRAIHWVDVEWDGVEELVFWTEGLSPGWQIKEALFVVKVPQEGDSEKTEPSVFIFRVLDNPSPSTTSEGYRYVRFTPYPNAALGANDFVRAVLSYVSIGASGSTFAHLSIEYNRYEAQVEINRFSTPFPFIIEEGIPERPR